MFASAARALLEPSPARQRSFEVSARRRALFFSAALVVAPLLRVVLDLELYTPAMARTDEQERLMRRKVESFSAR